MAAGKPGFLRRFLGNLKREIPSKHDLAIGLFGSVVFGMIFIPAGLVLGTGLGLGLSAGALVGCVGGAIGLQAMAQRSGGSESACFGTPAVLGFITSCLVAGNTGNFGLALAGAAAGTAVAVGIVTGLVGAAVGVHSVCRAWKTAAQGDDSAPPAAKPSFPTLELSIAPDSSPMPAMRNDFTCSAPQTEQPQQQQIPLPFAQRPRHG